MALSAASRSLPRSPFRTLLFTAFSIDCMNSTIVPSLLMNLYK
ncbi:hypothetical protein COLO4_20915 [Corchorus olitorius]|uniref:Uncharacterized protein n=1 Tax=Corchorus olitorius TaxID=93759 RepID=A0A1R3IW76_9ROSI|nr:hypothetical protein COLO4_20915 [Corchorus olitorius]